MNSKKRSQINTGIILVGVGILFLLHSLGILSGFNWHLLFQYWPLVIIFIGLNIILKNSAIWWVVPVLFIFAIISLFVIHDGPGYYRYEYDYEFNLPSFPGRDRGIYRSDMGFTEEMDEMDVTLNFSAGKLVIDSVRDEENLYEARLKYNYGRPFIDYLNKREKKGYLNIRQPERVTNWLNISNPNDWKLYLTSGIPVNIELNAGAGNFNFNLEELRIRQLVINTGAGNLEADLNRYTRYVKLNSAAAKIELNLPVEMGINVKSEALISKNNFAEMGLNRIDSNSYRTPNYDQAEEKIDIEINAPASQVELDFYRVN